LAKRAVETRIGQRAEILTGHAVFNEVVRRSSTDLAMLTTKTPGGQYPYAGVPWFSTVFGRDALITAIEMLWLDPDLARDVLRYLAHHQAHTTDPTSDAAPGKILHEVRRGEMAVRGEVPFGKYYGSVEADITPMRLSHWGGELTPTWIAKDRAAGTRSIRALKLARRACGRLVSHSG
jgi:glycogen debranching enzyme